MKQKLREFCRSIGIDAVGIAPAGPYKELEVMLRNRRELGLYTELEEQDLAKRIDPHCTLPGVQSVIVCLFPYYTGDIAGANLPRYAYGRDYHNLVRKKLEQIGAFLTDRIPGFIYQAFVDTGPLADRYLAYLAGLGFYGLNSHIITDRYGSYVVIGYLLNNYPFSPDQPQERVCRQCGRCIRACPGQVILGNYRIDPRGCRSYLTQKKGELTEEERRILQRTNLLFGCDVCQEVCPHNQEIELTSLPEFRQDLFGCLNGGELDRFSNREFKEKYGDRAFSWRGKGILLRNWRYLKAGQDV
ncbi:epoxyqueuosine reductase queg [Lucifera butyrica]|uniref:Epoxyqueuosine reductase queg n=2 Tax=Lucifera butyrica TaxID=1351585 RepID=A0A498R9G7_9FIRM|nr:epoxyqueuosine reductase queg [Lucifera butyrica]